MDLVAVAEVASVVAALEADDSTERPARDAEAFNGTPGAGRNGGFNGTPGAGGRFRGTPGPNGSGAPGAGRNFAVGTVAKVDGNTVTLNMANGSTGTFTISTTTRFQKNVTIQLTDLQVGDNIVAAGQQSGNVFQATSIQVVTGFGGGGGSAQSGANAHAVNEKLEIRD